MTIARTFPIRSVILLLLPLGLAGCVDMEESVSLTASPSRSEQACLAAVSNKTNNGDVAVVGSTSAESGNFVTIGVGPGRAPWQCATDAAGNVWNVQSMTNEGAL